ncbi:MAG: hypothetical protein ACLP6E_12885 [Acidimicrobiales bacterium]
MQSEGASSPARRFARSCAVAIALCGAAFSWLVTDGTFNFLQSAPFSNFYDVQARSLLHGTWSMPASVLTIEGIRIDGQTYMYYGPMPAILRIPILIFTHRLDGRLTQPSLLIGFVVALTFASLLSWRIRGVVRGPVDLGRFECWLTAGLIVVVGLGSVLFFLGSTAQVYEEAEMWGAAFTLGAFYSLIGFLERPVAGRLVSTGIFATLAMLTRGSVGAGPLVAIGLVALVYLLSMLAGRFQRYESQARRIADALALRVAERQGRFLAGLFAALGVPLALYAWVNEAKFGTPFSIPVGRQIYSLENAHRRAVLAANGGSLFGLKFLPTNLVQFVRPDALSVTRLFPFLFFPGKALVIGHLLYDTRDWTSSIPACMPVLFVLALVGIVVAYKRRPPPESPHVTEAGLATLRIPLVGAAAGTYGILTIAFIAQRYLADAIPLLVLASLAGWHFMAGRVANFRGGLRAVGATLLAVLTLFGLWATFSLSLFYQRELGPLVSIPQRAGMVAFQQQLDRSLFGGPPADVRFVSALPPSGQALELAVVGSCAAVYQFDGNLWQPVELGAAGGAVGLEATFVPTALGRRQPLLVTGGTAPQDVVAVTWEGGDRYSFSYIFDGTLLSPSARAWYQEQAVVVGPGPHQVQIDLVTQLGMVFITLDRKPVFSLLYPVAPPTLLRLGSAPASVSTTGRFYGSVHLVPVPTPICHELEQHRSAMLPAPAH